MSSVVVPWVAGVLDVRGYLSERPSSVVDRRLPTVAVTMRDLGDQSNPVIAQLCAWTDVEPIAVSKHFNRSGCGQHCPEPHVHVSGAYRRWMVGGVKAVIILRAALPYLLVQQDEARRLIALSRDRNWKPMHVRTMARLGWPVDGVLPDKELTR